MTEAEWEACADPAVMDAFSGRSGTQRRWRLFACHCCRRVLPMLSEVGRNAVSVAERQAEGTATDGDVLAVQAETAEELKAAWEKLGSERDRALASAAQAAFYTLALPRCAYSHVGEAVPGPSERLAQCHLFRDIFGNPFRPVPFDPAWLTPTVTSLATAAYEDRILPKGELDPHRLAVLADALEEVGAAEEVVTHLRSPGPHVRGCWAVDLCLGKA